MACHEDNLWIRLLRAKYLKGQIFFEYKLKKGSSQIWRAIVNARMELKGRVCFKIGNGYSIKPCTDPWIPSLLDFIPKLKGGHAGCELRCVADLYGIDGWKIDLVKNFFNEISARAILNTPWPTQLVEDTLMWKGNSSVFFSVRSNYL